MVAFFPGRFVILCDLEHLNASSDGPCSAVSNRSTSLLGLEFDRMILIFGSDRLPLSLVNDPTRSSIEFGLFACTN